MRLVSLELSNFRRFREAAIEFPDGVVGLLGANGSGKSTLLEAIGWAVYGHEAARTGKDHLRRRGAGGMEPVRVRLAFDHAGHRYEVLREQKGFSQSPLASVAVDGAVVVRAGPNSAREATESLARALGLDATAFFAAIVARQSELAALSDRTPGARKRTILRMLGIDAVEAAIEKARTRRRILAAEIEGLARASPSDPSARAARRSDVAARRGRLEADAAAVARRVAETEPSIATLQARREALERALESHRRVSEQILRREDRLERMRRELSARKQELAEAETATRTAADLQSAAAPLASIRAEVADVALRAARAGDAPTLAREHDALVRESETAARVRAARRD
ncbi:MAG: AAA family ATPase, partial [Methanobacteriota archaeon]